MIIYVIVIGIMRILPIGIISHIIAIIMMIWIIFIIDIRIKVYMLSVSVIGIIRLVLVIVT